MHSRTLGNILSVGRCCKIYRTRALEDTALSAGLEEDDVALMEQEEPAWVLRFRAVELWEQLRRWLGK